ncbi:glycosyltransferase [Sphingomonas baiyangensis]|uniref:Glycosyltransferase n=2 Tax=Sphingomonas baiyangensis TaxID=2572576 RepID=A0A4U1L6Y2_9SPHN|nr:glycosyltransferase [Sphingomonas baiyangensis]
MLRLAAGWLDRGAQVTLLLGDAAGPLASECDTRIALVPLGDRRYRTLLGAARDIARRAPDIVFVPGNHYSALGLAARGGTTAPIVGKLSNALSGVHRGLAGLGYAAWLRLHPRFLDHLVAMSPAMGAEAARAMRMPLSRISVIANPPARSIADAPDVALPPGRFVLGVGRLAPQKRWDRLVAAFARLPDPALSLVILGEGPERVAIEAHARALGIAARVHLPGHAADPLPAMRRAALVALTSDHEGVPGVIREALGEGTPVVSTDSSVAIAELLADPAAGTIVRREDSEGLVAALAAWLAPDARCPTPIRPTGDPASDYLALFERLTASPRRGAQP